MTRLDITRRLQQRLLEIVGTALPLIAGSMADADLVGIAHLRGEMVEAVDAYRAHVAGLRDAALTDGDARALARAQGLADGCASIDAAYAAFRDRWVHRRAVENWHEYRLSAIVMMKQVRDHVIRAGLAEAA